MKEMLVSIITPNYNGAKHIKYSIESVVKQTYTNWELIIVDDKSTDESVMIINQYAEKDPRIKLYINDTNCGVLKTRNIAIKEACGEIIAFLDSDDIWYENKLEEQINVYTKFPDATVVFCNYEYIAYDGKPLNKIIKSPALINYRMLLKTCYIGCLTMTYNVTVLGKRYFFHEGHEDYALWLSILKEGYTAINVKKCLAKYRISDKSISSNKFKTAKWQWDIYRNVEKLNLIQSFYYFSHYIYYGLKKHIFY